MIELSQVILYVLLALIGFFAIVVFWFQVNVIKGKAMKNPDGSVDDWHEQKIFYGIALADLFLSVPATIAGIMRAQRHSRKFCFTKTSTPRYYMKSARAVKNMLTQVFPHANIIVGILIFIVGFIFHWIGQLISVVNWNYATKIGLQEKSMPPEFKVYEHAIVRARTQTEGACFV